MLDEQTPMSAVTRLRLAAGNTALPEQVRTQAHELAERLARGVRIVILGPAGVGKSTLYDTFLALSRNRDAAPAIVNRSDTGFAADDLPAGARGCDLADADILGRARIIDLAPAQVQAGLSAEVGGWLERADIVLWCTQDFGAQEALLWRDAPDHLKDHSFLILTQADRLAEEGVLQQRIAALGPVVSEEFHSFFPVTLRHLQRLRSAGEAFPDAALRASGLQALVEAVALLVRSGERADLDSAVLFLERHGLGGEDGLILDADQPAAELTGREDAEPDPAFEACRAARDRIIAQARDLAEAGFGEAGEDTEALIDLCTTLSEEMVTALRDAATRVPELARWGDSFEEAADRIMLMGLENHAEARAEAIALLLQVRRDLEQLDFH